MRRTAGAGRTGKATVARPENRTATLGTAPLLWTSAALVALTVAVFAPVRHFSFVSWDDPFYVTDNPVVRHGLTPASVVWAFTSSDRFYWHPLTWLSHMADVQLFGLDAGAHHVTNVVLHCAASLLLFLVLQQMTGRVGRSAFVAAIFAVHPLHVESVAWIAERKDVLSGVFWMLTLWVYAHYVRVPGKASYAALVAPFALGLMSKPTVVTLPLVLLLLDVWPLERELAGHPAPPSRLRSSDARTAGVTRLVVEKIPLFALALATAVVTFATQLHVGAVQTLDVLPLRERLANAVVSIVGYIGMTVWPSGLAAFYPFRPVAGWRVVTCLLILATVSYAVIRSRCQRPYLMVGWLWYLVTLLPVIGLVQVGSQSMADRFTYLPIVGLLLAGAWGAVDVATNLGVRRNVLGACALAVVATCAVAARVQTGYWKDSQTLWRRAVSVVANNDLAHANLGVSLAAAGQNELALTHLSEALRIVKKRDATTDTGGTPPPEYAAFLHNQLGLLLARQGQWKEAVTNFREVVRLDPASVDAHHALGQALAADGQLAEAIQESREAIRLAPDRADLHGDFASVLYRNRDLTGAIAELEQALRLQPGHRSAAKWHYNLAAMLNESGRRVEAIRHLETALAINPGYQEAAQALAALRNERR